MRSWISQVKKLNMIAVQTVSWGSLFAHLVASPALGVGDSMLPVIEPNSIILVQKWFSSSKIKVGDIVACQSPVEPAKYVCKRVAGVAGDTVIIDSHSSSSRCIKITSNHVFLRGENHQKSFDSRSYGPVPLQNIVGIVRFSIFPKFKFL
eukprot:NODE_586_length_5672_cov_0.462229.p5 type:complete len:150 gc:universal NODE_586_length_5672_cov_0.462229:5132-5581(+)